jgi:hypothetical protein
VLEFESLLQVFYAEHSTKVATRARIAEMRAWAEEQNAENIAFARLYRGSDVPFPQRVASIVLVGKFLTDFADMVCGRGRIGLTRWSHSGRTGAAPSRL